VPINRKVAMLRSLTQA